MYFKLAIVLSLVLVGQAYKSNRQRREANSCNKGCDSLALLVFGLKNLHGDRKGEVFKLAESVPKQVKNCIDANNKLDKEQGSCRVAMEAVNKSYTDFYDFLSELMKEETLKNDSKANELFMKTNESCLATQKAVENAKMHCTNSKVQAVSEMCVLKIDGSMKFVSAEIIKCNNNLESQNGDSSAKRKRDISAQKKIDSEKKEDLNENHKSKRSISQKLKELLHI